MGNNHYYTVVFAIYSIHHDVCLQSIIISYSEENAALTELTPFTEEPVTPLELQTRFGIMEQTMCSMPSIV